MDFPDHRLRESLARFRSVLSPEEIQKLLFIQDQPLPTGIRINPLKADPETAIQDLSTRYGWDVDSIPFCKNGWTIHQARSSPGRTIEHRLGQYYLQDAASMVPVSLFDFSDSRLLILDMAASPGGKTTHLIDRTLDQGFILANDSSKSRISSLRSVLTSWGGINQAVTQFPGESIGAWYPERFDYVLLDAPCSMENLRPSANHPLRETTSDERMRLQSRQIELLKSGLSALKIGGQLVYATCSLAPEEDEAVIDALLKQYAGNFAIDDLQSKIPFSVPGLTQYNGQSYHPDLIHALRLWPHLTGMSGFFCARLTKLEPLLLLTDQPPSRAFNRTNLEPVENRLQTQVMDQIATNYGLDLQEIMIDRKLELYQRYDQLFLLPRAYLQHFETLPFALAGMQLGRWQDGVLEPSPEFISRFGHHFKYGIIQIEDDLVDLWIAGRDIRNPVTNQTPLGQYLLVTDASGRNLGLGKLLPKRLRNMLPR